jgi:hypothetical protein
MSKKDERDEASEKSNQQRAAEISAHIKAMLAEAQRSNQRVFRYRSSGRVAGTPIEQVLQNRFWAGIGEVDMEVNLPELIAIATVLRDFQQQTAGKKGLIRWTSKGRLNLNPSHRQMGAALKWLPIQEPQ